MIKVGAIKMKCELKYVIHEKIKLYKSTTLKELLILTPIAAAVVLCGGWLIGVYNMVIIIVIVYFLLTCLSFKNGIKYCKSKKD